LRNIIKDLGKVKRRGVGEEVGLDRGKKVYYINFANRFVH
jgi:hypothetical protein